MVHAASCRIDSLQGAEIEVPGPWLPGNIGPLLDQHRANPLLAQQEGRDKPAPPAPTIKTGTRSLANIA